MFLAGRLRVAEKMPRFINEISPSQSLHADNVMLRSGHWLQPSVFSLPLKTVLLCLGPMRRFTEGVDG